MLGFILKVFLGFIAIMDPIGNAPIFIGLTEGFDRKTKKIVAKKSNITAFIIVAIFTVGGNIIFRLFGVTLPAFRTAGGILLFIIAYHLLTGRRSRQHHSFQEEDISELAEEIAVTPLGTPILAGPGTIVTAMSFVGGRKDPLVITIVLGVFLIVCIITYVCFVLSERLVEKLGSSTINVIVRLMGLILAVIAIQMLFEGIKGAFNL